MIDFDDPRIRAFLQASGWEGRNEEEKAEAACGFVRDEVQHSMDIGDPRVTIRASEVLEHRVGICYAKSHLLAALLRGLGLPTGICYQRLLATEEPADGYVLHALNAVYLGSHGRWVRMDARGNRPGIDARFSLDTEH
ncbi:hypothetical protein BH11ARM2_BH11ARM2_21730 [soil metagenome]